jgi:hypothetical protein
MQHRQSLGLAALVAKSMTAGQDYFGELLLGPDSAPTALHVPITIHRN